MEHLVICPSAKLCPSCHHNSPHTVTTCKDMSDTMDCHDICHKADKHPYKHATGCIDARIYEAHSILDLPEESL